MEKFAVYSNDQIEARYILTPTFIEEIENLASQFIDLNLSIAKPNVCLPNALAGLKFNQVSENISNNIFGAKILELINDKNKVSLIFNEGWVYICMPTYYDFLEIDTSDTLLNPEKYYHIITELDTIMSIIELMKFDKVLGV